MGLHSALRINGLMVALSPHVFRGTRPCQRIGILHMPPVAYSIPIATRPAACNLASVKLVVRLPSSSCVSNASCNCYLSCHRSLAPTAGSSPLRKGAITSARCCLRLAESSVTMRAACWAAAASRKANIQCPSTNCFCIWFRMLPMLVFCTHMHGISPCSSTRLVMYNADGELQLSALFPMLPNEKMRRGQPTQHRHSCNMIYVLRRC